MADRFASVNPDDVDFYLEPVEEGDDLDFYLEPVGEESPNLPSDTAAPARPGTPVALQTPQRGLAPRDVAPAGEEPTAPQEPSYRGASVRARQRSTTPEPTAPQPSPALEARLAGVDQNPDGTAVVRAAKRGGLRTAATVPTMRANVDAQSLADAQNGDAWIIRDAFLEVTGLKEVPPGADLSSPRAAIASLPPEEYPTVDKAELLMNRIEDRRTRAAEAAKNPAGVRSRAEGNIATAASLMKRAQALPMSPGAERMKLRMAEDESLVGTIATLLRHPGEAALFLSEVGIESTPQIAASAATAVVTRSPSMSAAALGAGTVTQEYGSSVFDFLQEHNVPLETEEDAIAVLSRPDLLQEAGKRGLTRGVVIAAFEMMGQGIAAKQLLKSRVGDALAQTFVQMSTGGGGEASAMLASGQDLSPQEILIEALAETVQTPAEVGTAAYADRKAKARDQLLTERDRASAIPNDVIAKGKEKLAEIAARNAGDVPEGAVPMSTLYGDDAPEAATSQKITGFNAAIGATATPEVRGTVGLGSVLAPQSVQPAPQQDPAPQIPQEPNGQTPAPAEPQVENAVPPQEAQPATGPAKAKAPVTRPRLQKRPFTAAIKEVGIHPEGAIAAELRAQDITPQTVPGLFKRTGAKDLDNLPAEEWQEWAGMIGTDGQGYLDRDSIINALIEENSGRPVQVGTQAALQQEADDAAETEAEIERARQAGELDDPAEVFQEPTVPVFGTIPARSRDIRSDEERVADVRAEVQTALSEPEFDGLFTAEETDAVVNRLVENGGDIEDALYWELTRNGDNAVTRGQYENREGVELDDIPFGDNAGELAAGPRQGDQGAGQRGAGVTGGERAGESRGAAPDSQGERAPGRGEAQGAGDAGPVEADAFAAARAAGEVQHVTKKGKTLTGYVVRGIGRDEAKAADKYTFRKDGGYFIRKADMPAAAEESSVKGKFNSENKQPTPQEESAEREAETRAKRARVLRTQAEKAIEKADADLNADRQDNTARRARMAANAIGEATRRKRNAETLAAIADAQAAGETPLDTVKSVKDVERVETALRRAQFAGQRQRGESYAEREKAGPPTLDDVQYMERPSVLVRQGVLGELVEAIKGRRGAPTQKLQAMQRQRGENFFNVTGNDVDTIEQAIKIAKKAGKLGYQVKMLADDITDYRAMQRILGDDREAFFEAFFAARSGTTVKRDPVKEARQALRGQKIPGFFETPEALAQRMVEAAGLQKGDKVLEPSAGLGRIASAAAEVVGKENVDVIERNVTMQGSLTAQGFNLVDTDFTEFEGGPYDVILMNPPFENGQDAEHIQRAFGMLKPGGRLVAIAGEGIFFRGDKASVAFRDWLEEQGGTSEKLPEGTFKESGTGTNTRIVEVARDWTEEDYAEIDRQEAEKKEAASKPDMLPLAEYGMEKFQSHDVWMRTIDGSGGSKWTYWATRRWNGYDGKWEVIAKRVTKLAPEKQITNPPTKELGTFTSTDDAIAAMVADGLPKVERSEPQAAERSRVEGMAQTGNVPRYSDLNTPEWQAYRDAIVAAQDLPDAEYDARLPELNRIRAAALESTGGEQPTGDYISGKARRRMDARNEAAVDGPGDNLPAMPADIIWARRRPGQEMPGGAFAKQAKWYTSLPEQDRAALIKEAGYAGEVAPSADLAKIDRYKAEAILAAAPIEAQAQGFDTEATPEGEQTFIPGTRDDQGRDRLKDQAEIDARAQQSKIRRGEQQRVEDDAGGLFADPMNNADLFDAPPPQAAPQAEPDTGGGPDVAPSDSWPRPLSDVADTSQGRVHLYGEFMGGRYYVGTFPSYQEAEAAATAKGRRYPGASFFTHDRADSTSINGTEDDLQAAVTPAAEPTAEPETEAEQPTTRAKDDKIEDFGEVLEGAAKHRAAEWAKRIGDVPDMDVVNQPLSKSWPEPNYQQMLDDGVDPAAVAFIRSARDEIPVKPRGWRAKRWAEQVVIMRDFARKLADGTHTMTEVQEKAQGVGILDGVMGRTELYQRFGHDKSLKGIDLKEHSYSVKDGRYYNPSLRQWEVTQPRKASAWSNMPRTLSEGATKQAAIEAFAPVHEALDAGKKKTSRSAKNPFSIWRDRTDNKVHVGRKIGSDYTSLATFDDVAEARTYRDENQDALTEKFEKWKEVPFERNPENRDRIGQDRRDGRDVSPETFQEAFGFRGVQFGNYVEGPRRQADLNQAYDALSDLSAAIDVPTEALSLHGSLGLAFGARGKGGKGAYAAHFEPDSIVINLTKRSGAGSLAHEWWHGLDNYFSRMKGLNLEFLSERTRGTSEGVRPEVVAAFKGVNDALRATGMPQRATELDKRRSLPYWSTTREMTARVFEQYIIDKVESEGGSNDFLANIVSEETWRALDAFEGRDVPSYPYLRESEREAVFSAFDALFDALETEQTDSGVRIYQQQEAPVATLTGEELGPQGNYPDLQQAAQDWYADNLRGTTVRSSTGWDVRFSAKGQRKSTKKSADILRVVPAIRAIIERGNLVETRPGRDRGTKFMHVLAAPVSVAGETRTYVVTIREATDGHFHYDLGWMDEGRGQPQKAEGGRNQVLADPAWKHPDPDLNIGILDPDFNPPAADPARITSALADLRKILDRMGLKGVSLEAGPEMTEQAAFERDQYGNMRIIIGAAANPEASLRHEVIHALKASGVFTKAEWAALEQRARSLWMKQYKIAERYGDLTEAQQIEEAIAEGFANWKADAPASPIKNAFAKVRRLLRAVRDWMQGHGIQNADDLFGAIERGEVGARQRDIAFDRWFGNSKIVDDKGNPLVVYHGTKSEFDAFSNDTGAYGNRGIYFSPSRTAADIYSQTAGWWKDETGGTPRVLAVYLKIENPKIINEPNARGKSAFLKESEIAEMVAEGYDGVWNKSANEIIAFRPDQIKSVDNVGTFNPSDPRIMYQRQAARDQEVSEEIGERIEFAVTPEATPQERQESFLKAVATQPLDSAFKLLFMPFGGIDKNGKFRLGVRGEEWLSDKIANAKFSDDSLLSFMNPAMERARIGLRDRHGLPEEYVELERQRGINQSLLMSEGLDFVRQMQNANMSPAEAQTLQAILTGEAVDEAQFGSLPEAIRRSLDEMGQEAVRLGLLSPESFERNRGTYLHRVYEGHEAQVGPLGKMTGSMARGRRVKIAGDQFKGRGIFEEVDAEKIWKGNEEYLGAKRGKPQKGDKVIILDKMSNAGQGELDGVKQKKARRERRVYWPAEKPIPARYQAYENRGTFEVRGEPGQTITLWRDFTKEERTRMGEILDARYTVAKTYHMMAQDLATGRFFKALAENEEWVKSSPPEGAVVAGEDKKISRTDPSVEWIRVPSSKIGTSDTLVYGAIAGKYIRADIWRDMEELRRMQTPGFWRPILTQWKLNKALSLDTPIPTADGWTTMGEIKVGDRVFDETGKVCFVEEVKDIQYDRPCFMVEFSDGTSIIADDEHWWFTNMRNRGGGVRTTKEIRETLLEPTRGDSNHSVPVAEPLDLPSIDLPVPPYALGFWIGDGDKNAPRVTMDSRLFEEIKDNLGAIGVHCGSLCLDKRSNAGTVTIDVKPVASGRGENSFKEIVREIGLLGNKHIPAAYLRASKSQRLELLQGLMDSDGWITSKGTCGFAASNAGVYAGAMELLRSLGLKPTVREFESASGKPAWRIHFQAYSDLPVFKLEKKLERMRPRPATNQRSRSRQIVSIEPVESVPVRCISVSSKSHLYLAGEGMVPTHNTARNPVVHMNNIMSNFMLMDMASVRMTDLAAAMLEIRRGGDLYEEARSHGAFGSDMVAQEIRRDVLEPMLKEIRDELRDGKGGLEAEAARIGLAPVGWIADRAIRGIAAADRAMVSAYQMEDEVFRMATYLRRRKEGMSAQEAAIEARDQFLNYDIRAPWVNAARNSVLPFVSYTYRAIPRLFKTMAERPWKIAKYATVAYMLNNLGYLLAPSGDDEEEERGSLRKEEQGHTWVGTERLIRMPWLSGENPVFLDTRRWIPGGDIFETGQNEALPWVPNWMQVGGPLVIGAELWLNRSAFTGEDIVNDVTDTTGEKITKQAGYLYRSWMPSAPWIPEGWYWNKIGRALNSEARTFSGDPYRLSDALLSSIGIKVQPKDVDFGYQMHEFEFDRIERDLGMQTKSLRRQRERGLVSKENYEREIDRLRQKSARLNEARRDVQAKRR